MQIRQFTVSGPRWRLLSCAVAVCVVAVPVLTAAESPSTPVILISIDTLRADHLGVYGYRRASTPNIDSFAAGGTVFGNVSCQIPLTLPSHLSLFTSTYPFSNGIENNAEQVPQGVTTLAGALRGHGYRTAAFIGAVYLERSLGIDQGFDFYDSPFSFTAFSSLAGSMFFGDRDSNPLGGRDRRQGPLVVRAALQWLGRNRGNPVFAFVHLFDLHEPYHLPRSANRRPGLSDYDAQLEYVDGVMGALRNALVRAGWWDRSLVILVSDHGESLGEHGEQTHGYFIYQSTVHVPLVIHWPSGGSRYPQSAPQPAGLIDVAPTILDFLRLPAPASFAGHTLLPSLSGDSRESAAVYSESVYSHDAFGWAPLRSVRVDRYKYIAAPKPELYDLAADPGELRNIVSAHPAEAHSLESRLAALLASHAPRSSAPRAAVPASRLAALRSLGYLAPGGGLQKTAGPDPKDKLSEYRAYERAQYELLSGHNATAIAILSRILQRDPRNTLARRDLGIAYNAAGRYEKARAALEQAVAAAPQDFVAHFELGVADEHAGRLPEALQQLQTACAMAPESGGCRRELQSVKNRNTRRSPHS